MTPKRPGRTVVKSGSLSQNRIQRARFNHARENLFWAIPSRFVPSGAPPNPPSVYTEMMAGLPLPDVVRELLRDPGILMWHPDEEVYEVMDGPSFERR